MWTLATAIERVSSRVGEDSTVFWTAKDRVDAINDAQRFIASVTQGVPSTVSGLVSVATPFLPLAGSVAGMHGSAGRIAGGASLSMVRSDVADLTFPAWRSYVGTPKWVIVDMADSRAYLAPVPQDPIQVEVTIATIPDDFTLGDDTAPLFNGSPHMRKFLGAFVNYAAAMLLLRERFDGDAERFYQLALNDLREAGIDVKAVPPLVTSPAQE